MESATEENRLTERETANYKIIWRKNRYHLLAKSNDVTPRLVPLRLEDRAYLEGLNDSTFDMAAILDFGCGVYQRRKP